jgi:HEAT repeat protein
MDWLTGGQAGEARRFISHLEDPSKRERAGRELLKMGVVAVPALISTLDGSAPNLGEQASALLIKIGASAVSLLGRSLISDHPVVRGRVAEILGAIGDRESVPMLLDALTGEFYTVRTKAATALGQIRDPAAIPALVSALKDQEPEVRIAASRALGKFADPQTFEALGNVLLDDPQIEVRQAAAQAFGETGRAEAIPYLMDALHDSFWWYERQDEVEELLAAIISMGPSVVPELIAALGDPEGTVRRFAAYLLGRIPDERAIEPLSLSLYDTHFEVCRESAAALAAMGPPAVPVLIAALHQPEAWLRQQAVIGLTKSADPQVIPELIAILQDEARDVRKQAIVSLGQLHDPRGLAALQELAAKRTDREIASLAKEALKGQGS